MGHTEETMPITIEQIQRWLRIVEREYLGEAPSYEGGLGYVVRELRDVERDMLRQEAHGKEEQPVRR
jgi:hypothetical protein